MIYSWWNEILDNSECHIQNKNDLISCVDKMVSIMSQKSCFSLSIFLFQNKRKEVEYLASSGLIIKSNDTIAFAHQSILDAFLISKDLDFIYDGGSLLQSIINWGKQTPDKKYRFSALLQNLIDSDPTLFIRETESILNSVQIHYYFKCTIFEVLGQHQTPGDAMFRLIDDFYRKEEWHGFIKNTIFAHHVIYLQHLAKDSEYDWMGEEGLSLLWTVRNSAPAFVVDVLRKSISSEQDIEQALSVLTNRIDEEPEELFHFRVELYEKNKELLSGLQFINVKRASPAHVTTILKLFVRNFELYGKTHLYLQSEEEIGVFIQKNFSFILSELFEELCKQAKVVPISLYSSENYYHREWYPSPYEQSVIRDVVDLVKMSINKLAEVDPEETLHYVSLSERNKNAITNEIVLSALIALPTTYSDQAISWILSDFEKNIVDCVSNEQDYLASCKKIIEKHSLCCSEELFRLLEEKIYNWCDDRKVMIKRYKRRVEFNRENIGSEPIYWTFWGSLQKELLPMLAKNRTSTRVQALISVLYRNDWIKTPGYHSGITLGSVRSVVSTIHNRAEKLSDKTWLAIATSKIDEEHGRWRGTDRDQYYYETSHPMFASDMGKCADRDPERFARLSLRFPENIDPAYITNVMSALGKDTSITVDFDLVRQVVRKYMSFSNENLVMNILRIISNRANETWPEDIIKYVVAIATGSMRPVRNECVILHDDDKENLSPYTLENNAINLPRSEAVYTIAHLLDEHPSYKEIFKPVLEELCKDESDIVRYALVQCVALFYQYDSQFATRIFDKLLKQDLRIISERNAFWIMTRNIRKYYDFLMKACDSPSQELAEEAARLLCKVAIYTSDTTVLKSLYGKGWSKEFIDLICGEAINAFDYENHRQTSQQILEFFISDSEDHSIKVDGLFRNNRLDLHRDKELIFLILQKQNNSDTVYAFVNFLKTQDTPEITEFAEIISDLVKNINKNENSWKIVHIEDDLISIVISLIDRAGENKIVMEICLDILDSIYKKGIFTNSAISRLMEGAE